MLVARTPEPLAQVWGRGEARGGGVARAGTQLHTVDIMTVKHLVGWKAAPEALINAETESVAWAEEAESGSPLAHSRG